MVSATIGATIARVLGLLGIFSIILSCSPKVQISTIGSTYVKAFCIKKESSGKNPLLDNLIKEKLKKNLIARGFKVQEECKEYTLTFDYGVTPVQIYVPRIVYGPSEVLTFTAYRLEQGKATPEIYTVLLPPATYYYEDKQTLYIHWLMLKLQKNGSPLWIGEISYEDDYPDIRANIDILIEKLLDYFGKDTGRTIEVRLK